VAIGALLAASVLAVYWRTSSFPFVVYDDEPLIVRNRAIQEGLTWDAVRWAFTSVREIGWLPVTWLSHLSDVSLFGMDAGKHHLVNVALHLATTLAMFAVLRRATGRTWESGLAAAIFAVHPLHVESVAWVSERKDILCAFFWMLTIGAYVRYVERPGTLRYCAALGLFALALMSKPMAVTLPFVLLLLDFWPLGRMTRASGAFRLVSEKAPFFLLAAAACVATLFAQREMGAIDPAGAIPFWARAANAALACGAYLRQAVWPSGLAVFYPHPGVRIGIPGAAASAALVAGATVAVLLGARRRPWLAVGWLWFLGTLVPVIGLVQAGGQARADRYTYLPLVGLAVAVSWGAGRLAERGAVARRCVVAASLAWLSLLSALAFHQVGYWRDSKTLFLHAIEVTRDNWIARNNLGVVLRKEGELDAAIVHLREALRIFPDYAEARFNLGQALSAKGMDAEAEANFREMLRLVPESADARRGLADHYSDAGRPDEAEPLYREAIRLKPDYPEAHNNLGVLLARRGASGEAAAHFMEAVRLWPGYEGARRNLEQAMREGGQVHGGGAP
jgi:Flp pilus assembly protein TadD